MMKIDKYETIMSNLLFHYSRFYRVKHGKEKITKEKITGNYRYI